MKCTSRNLLLAGLLLGLCIPAAQAEPPGPPDPVDPFAATLRAAAAIPKAKDRVYTLERVAVAWARTDFCDEALRALQVEGDQVDAGAALEAASICAETVAGETAGKLLGFAQVRITQTVDPEQRALHLASLAGAYHYLERLEERDRAAQEAAATLPETCDPLATVLGRTALARRFMELDMEAWAVHLLAGASRVALDLPGQPLIGGVWDPEDTPQEDLTKGVMGHLRKMGGDAAGFTPPPPLKGCPATKMIAADFVAPEKAVALAAVSTALRRLGDADHADLARLLAVSFVRAIDDPAVRNHAANEAAALLAKAAPAKDAVFFLFAVAEDAPDAVKQAFGGMGFRGRLATKNHLKEAISAAAERFPKEFEANRGTIEALLSRLDTTPATGLDGASADDLDAARVQAIALPDDSARNELLDGIARRYLLLGHADRAAGLARRMSGRTRDRLLWSIGMHHLDAARTVVALETIQAMKSDGRRVRALAEVALRLAKAGVLLDAAGADMLRKLAR